MRLHRVFGGAAIVSMIAGAACVPSLESACGSGGGAGASASGGAECPAGCDDANECTDDACEAGVCAHPPSKLGTACGDGEVCDGEGACVAGPSTRWGKCFVGGKDGRSWAIAVDGQGNTIVGGYFGGTVDVGGSLLTGTG